MPRKSELLEAIERLDVKLTQVAGKDILGKKDSRAIVTLADNVIKEYYKEQERNARTNVYIDPASKPIAVYPPKSYSSVPTDL